MRVASSALPSEIAGKIKGKLYGDMEKLKNWRSNWKGIEKVTFPAWNIVLKGAIDELLVDSAGKFIIMDFKTRGYPVKEDTHEHYRTQLDLYGLLFGRNGYPVADFGYLLFFYPKSYARGRAAFNTQLVKMKIEPRRGLQLLKKVHLIVSGRKPKADSECEWCEYRKNEV